MVMVELMPAVSVALKEIDLLEEIRLLGEIKFKLSMTAGTNHFVNCKFEKPAKRQIILCTTISTQLR